MKCISIDDFYKNDFEKTSEGDLVLDVRTREEFNEGHIKGSMNIPHEEVSEHVGKLKNYKRIYILCRRGARAMVAANMLIPLLPDIDWVCVNDGGMQYWYDNNYPVES